MKFDVKSIVQHPCFALLRIVPQSLIMFVACRRLTLRHLAILTRTSRYGASVPSEWVGSYCQTKGEYGSHDSDPITPHGLVPTRGSTQWTALHFNCMCVSDTPGPAAQSLWLNETLRRCYLVLPYSARANSFCYASLVCFLQAWVLF
jgi:hypothetical protein